MKTALTTAALVLALCGTVRASDLDLHHDRHWASKAMSEDHTHSKGQLRHRPYRSRPLIRPTEVFREVAPNHHHHAEPRVYGVEIRGHQAVRRDVLSNVACFSSIESLSVEANTEDGAWKDAQRNWENAVRWKYGERFMGITNAADVVKRCSRSSGNQSMIGRALEAVADAHKWRCEISAKPCMAPADHAPAVKGE